VLDLVAAAGCSSSSSTQHHAAAPVVTTDDQGSNPQTWMAYQTRHVDSRYQAGATAVSDLELPMLAGYTANNDKPYCDGQPHTATDRAWLTL